MIFDLYRKYLLADRLNKIADKAGIEIAHIELRDRDSYHPDVHAQVSTFRQELEAVAAKLLEAAPHLEVKANNGLLYLVGKTWTGLTYDFYLGGIPVLDETIEDRIRELVTA